MTWFWACLTAFAAPDRGLNTDVPDLGAGEQLPIARDRLWYTAAVFARVNPLGLISTASVGWRRRLSTSESVLLRDTYLMLGLNTRHSPAFGRVGVHAEVQPLAILKAWADYELVGYYGTIDQIYSVSDPAARYDDATIAQVGKTTGATTGSVFTGGLVLQAAAGPIAIRSTGQVTRYVLRLDADPEPSGLEHGWFYDQYWDRLAPNGDFMWLNDLDLLALLGDVRLGARWTASGTPGAPEGTDGALGHHRVGPLFAYQFSDQGAGSRFDQPTLFVLAQWWLHHPYRTGAEQPQALPLIAAGFAFRGDLLGPKPARPAR